MNQQWTLARTPTLGWPSLRDFLLQTSPRPMIGPGQALTRTIYLSLDPYQWGRMRGGTTKPQEVCHGRTVSLVVESRHPGFGEGDVIFNTNGWQEFGLVGDGISTFGYMFPRLLDPDIAPISTALGALGMLGLTAYSGVYLQCDPQPGETVVVSAASGGVGQIAGQIARIKGCRVVGIAGSATKCDFVKDTLGFDACVSHRSATLREDLRSACPDGIDIYFENVGGQVFEAVLPLLNRSSRITQCGMISQYGNAAGVDAQAAWQAMGQPFFDRQEVKVHGLFVGNFVKEFQDRFMSEMATWIKDGQVRYKEDLWAGLPRAPEAFIALLNGGNFGKTLVGVSDDPTSSAAIASRRASANVL